MRTYTPYQFNRAVLLEAGFARYWGDRYAVIADNPFFRAAFANLALENRARHILESPMYDRPKVTITV